MMKVWLWVRYIISYVNSAYGVDGGSTSMHGQGRPLASGFWLLASRVMIDDRMCLHQASRRVRHDQARPGKARQGKAR